MANLRCLQVTSVQELRDLAGSWDDLWWRSDVAVPTARAELLAQWLEAFQPHGGFRALVVADDRQWIAALPLVSNRLAGCIPVGGLPANAWMACGELMLDPTADVGAALDRLLNAARKTRWPLLWFNETMPESPRWQALLRASHRAGMPACYHERFRAARVGIRHPWDAYQKLLPKNHRQAMKRCRQRLEREGIVRLEMQTRLPDSRVESWLQEAFALENTSWKGSKGTSVLRTPGMFPYFVRHAEELARWGQLMTAALRLDGRLVAFVHGFHAKGVMFAHKISYDPAYAAFSPGQLLFHHILHRLHDEETIRELDFMGPISQAQSRWRPETYGVGRIVMAPRWGLGRAMIYAYQHGWRRWRDLSSDAAIRARELEESSEPEPVAVAE